MAENSQPEAEDLENMWQFQVETGPDHDIKVNGKELKGFEDFLAQLAHENKLNWWELGNLLLYLGVGQIAAADHMAEDTQGVARLSISFAQMYKLHREALIEGNNMIANPSAGDSIN